MLDQALLDAAAAAADEQMRTTSPADLMRSGDYTSRLDDLSRLDHGWLPGCPKPVESAITRAALILAHVEKQMVATGQRFSRPGIFPLSAGGIQLEWGCYETEIRNDGTVRTDHYCDAGDFDRTMCPEPCNEFHSYCTMCGKRQDGCAHHPNGELPDQPDGISADSRQLPDLAAAAERVRDYISVAGDGLYDEHAGKPLYARDLEALVRHATGARL